MKKALIILAIGLAAACAPHQSQMAAQTPPTPYPLPQNYQQMIVDHLKTVLFDADSLKDLKFEEPRVFFNNSNYDKLGFGPYMVGWEVPVWFNAKNRYGGYTGLQPHSAYFRGGELVYFI